MSNLTEVVLIMAIGIPHLVLFVLLEEVRKKRENEIVTGLIGAVPTSTTYRWFSLYTSWASPAVVQLGFQLLMLVVYLAMTGIVSEGGPKLVAYSALYFTCVGVIGSLMMSGLGYAQLRSILRQSEAD